MWGALTLPVCECSLWSNSNCACATPFFMTTIQSSLALETAKEGGGKLFLLIRISCHRGLAHSRRGRKGDLFNEIINLLEAVEAASDVRRGRSPVLWLSLSNYGSGREREREREETKCCSLPPSSSFLSSCMCSTYSVLDPAILA